MNKYTIPAYILPSEHFFGELRAVELRFNPHHDEKGRFCSGKGLDNSPKPAIIKLKDIPIHKSVGAKYRNYDIKDLKTGEHFNLVEGTKITNVKVFAGKGVKTPYRKSYVYANKYGGKASDWRHTKGIGIVDYYGEERRAELHWSECAGIGKYDFFVKEWLDD